MASRSTKRSTPSADDPYGSDSTSAKEEEKTIPFLRRLVDMLRENEEVISFYPGSVSNGQVTLGRIVVHDRLKVESGVLPQYFNHSSFASLRRQLNYFSFTRMGKGRQRGATYCNEAVIELDDILRLKRRSSSVGNNSINRNENTSRESPVPTSTFSEEPELNRPSVSMAQYDDFNRRTKRVRHTPKPLPPTIVTPRTSPDNSSDEGPRITLDLTLPSNRNLPPKLGCNSNFKSKIFYGDEDILAGCNALLSFSRGFHHTNGIGSTV